MVLVADQRRQLRAQLLALRAQPPQLGRLGVARRLRALRPPPLKLLRLARRTQLGQPRGALVEGARELRLGDNGVGVWGEGWAVGSRVLGRGRGPAMVVCACVHA